MTFKFKLLYARSHWLKSYYLMSFNATNLPIFIGLSPKTFVSPSPDLKRSWLPKMNVGMNQPLNVDLSQEQDLRRNASLWMFKNVAGSWEPSRRRFMKRSVVTLWDKSARMYQESLNVRFPKRLSKRNAPWCQRPSVTRLRSMCQRGSVVWWRRMFAEMFRENNADLSQNKFVTQWQRGSHKLPATMFLEKFVNRYNLISFFLSNDIL